MSRPVNLTALAIATAGGAGLSPFAQGTLGSLVALPFIWLSQAWSTESRVALWVAVTAIGTWATRVFCERTGSKDPGQVVIDEVIGMAIAAWTCQVSPGESGSPEWQRMLAPWGAAFVLFRVFDILKPPPVRQLDALSKKTTGTLAAFAVIADDILAGFMALGCVLLLQTYGPLRP